MPAGAPKGNVNGAKTKQATDALRLAVNRVIEGDPEGRTYLAKIAAEIVKNAADGDLGAAREVFDRIDGKAHQSVEVTTDNPLETHDSPTLARLAGLLEAAVSGHEIPEQRDKEGTRH